MKGIESPDNSRVTLGRQQLQLSHRRHWIDGAVFQLVAALVVGHFMGATLPAQGDRQAEREPAIAFMVGKDVVTDKSLKQSPDGKWTIVVSKERQWRHGGEFPHVGSGNSR